MKKTKNIIIAAALVALLLGIVVVIKPAPSSTKTNSDLKASGILVAEESAFDFGTISMAAGKVSHAFKIKNVGAEPVVIEKIYTSCMCTEAFFKINDETLGPYGMPGHETAIGTNGRLGPGKEATVEAVFDPAAHGPSGVGLAQRTVYLETNSAQSAKFGLSLQAVVTR